jgi:hypothetical protein
MTRSSKKLLLLAATLATSLNSLTTLEAGCHGSSGRRVYSSHNHVSHPVHSQPYYSHEVISHPQPVYVHSQPEPVYGSSPYSSVPVTSVPVTSSPFGVQVQQGSSIGATPVSLAQQVQMTQGTQQVQLPQNAFPQSTLQQGAVQQSLPQQGLPQQAATQQPGLQQSGSQQIGTASVDTTTAAELSALQALGGFAPPQAVSVAAAAQAQSVPNTAPGHVGNWIASMSNGARVQLALNADGTFSWSAVNSAGNASTFQGSYQFDGTTLTLNRGNDNQKLAGAITFTSAGTFNFKLSDAQAGSLAFTRS